MKMKKWSGVQLTVASMVLVLVAALGCTPIQSQPHQTAPHAAEHAGETIMLTPAVYTSDTAVERALQERRSIRQYQNEALTLAELSQLLWAAQGITHPSGLRTTPSAGALYPLEVYVVVGNVAELTAGLYRYRPQTHDLILIAAGDKRPAISQAALDQDAVQEAAAVLVLAAVYERTTVKYNERGIRYVYMEVGAAAQNVYLQAVSLKLGTVYIGAFHDEQVKQVLNLRAVGCCSVTWSFLALWRRPKPSCALWPNRSRLIRMST
jgi:SagB-type dehydrogenase family enzyme